MNKKLKAIRDKLFNRWDAAIELDCPCLGFHVPSAEAGFSAAVKELWPLVELLRNHKYCREFCTVCKQIEALGCGGIVWGLDDE